MYALVISAAKARRQRRPQLGGYHIITPRGFCVKRKVGPRRKILPIAQDSFKIPGKYYTNSIPDRSRCRRKAAGGVKTRNRLSGGSRSGGHLQGFRAVPRVRVMPISPQTIPQWFGVNLKVGKTFRALGICDSERNPPYSSVPSSSGRSADSSAPERSSSAASKGMSPSSKASSSSGSPTASSPSSPSSP